MKRVILTDDKGNTLCGSDGALCIDGRYGVARMRGVIKDYVNRFKTHFPEKAQHWSHYGIVSSFRDNPAIIHKI
jgi:hypothetical protein